MQGAYYYPAPMPISYVPDHPSVVVFSSVATVSPQTYTIDPKFMIEPSSSSASATASAMQPYVSHTQSTKAATLKSKVLITYYDNAITHVNYGKNSNDAQKLFNCLKSTDRTLDIKQLTINDDNIIEIPVSRAHFGGRKGFIPQAQFAIEEVDANANAPVSNLNNLQSKK